MHVTADSRITIPGRVRDCLGIAPDAEVDFVEENGRFYLVKIAIPPRNASKFHRFRGSATVKMRTADIMQLTRGEP